MSKNFKKYMSAYGTGWKLLTFLVCIALVAYFLCMAFGNDVKPAGLVIFIGLLLGSLLPYVNSLRFFAGLQANQNVESIETDFQAAVSKRKDKIRLGNQWIYRKQTSKLLTYQEIKQVYLYIHKTNFVENERALKYVDTAGKHHVLCKLELENKSNQEMNEIIALLLAKNPNIQIGAR